MARIEKLLLRRGIYEAPQGTFVASPSKLKRIERQVKRMKDAGIKIPVAWGHQPKAEPGDDNDRANKQYYLSKFNAGYLDDVSFDAATGNMLFRADIPGCEVDPTTGNILTETTLPDGRKVKSAVGEVSAAIKDWKDGKGRVWKDALIHVAITPLPVVEAQSGFRELSTMSGDGFAAPNEPGVTYLSLTHWLSTDDEDDMPDPNLFDDDEDEGGEESPKPPETPPEIEPKPADGEGKGGARLAEAIRILQTLGLHLPGDTTLDNLVERICVAGHALDKKNGEDEEDDDEEEDLYSPSGGQVQEEQRPIMMSLATETDPLRKKLLQKEQDGHRGKLLKRIARLEKHGIMSAAEASEMRSQVDGYELSLTAELDLVPKDLDRELSIWERIASRMKGAKRAGEVLLGRVGNEEKRPEVAPDETEAEIKRRAERVSQGAE